MNYCVKALYSCLRNTSKQTSDEIYENSLVSSANIACPGHSTFGEPERTTNPPSSSMNVDQDYRASPGSPGLLCSGQAMLAWDTGGSRSNPRLPGEAR